MSDATIDATKAELRRKARAQRAALSDSRRAEASAAATAHFFRDIKLLPEEMVAAFWPIRDEIDVKPVLTRLMDDGQPVCLPVVLGEGQPLELRHWRDGAALYPSGFGTLAPDELAPVVVPDVMLMPLLGFDKHGTRLGYGGGYYDRTLQSLARRPRLVGFAFSAQAFDFIPREPHDVPLDAVVTEDGVTVFGTSA
ncbi:MAG: 5-formyltetrahydrofolate cyclo-ligase [Devosia sp.]|jgi:5-formyltetrahydrofolate cyclo-ligase|uniref:5-formyltetrahydrofolate cyclo-ligase n=1 Tax=Devosia sp. TaxID=1871048 RepID=UPI0037BE3F24